MTEYDDDAAPLGPPQNCDVCGSARVLFATNAELHGRGCIAPEDRVYYCARCKASVGVHRGTVLPLGFMADAQTRALRARAHNEFDPIWRYGRITRRKAYELLSDTLNISLDACHIGMMSKAQLVATINFARDYMSEQNKIKLRREAKKNVKRSQRAERQANLARFKRGQQRKRAGGRFYNCSDCDD